METTHKICINDSRNMREIEDKSVDLIVTSPPYPMIEMWDNLFSDLNPAINESLNNSDGKTAFKLMHEILDNTWNEVDRVLKEGGIACINIGDATRKIGDSFELYPNHIKIANYFFEKGYSELPSIIWRKTSNKPNKFMGSGMYPVNAYVTLEHEYILIFRKGNLKKFSKNDVQIRRMSAFFWEERNKWFSDIWNGLTGTKQNLKDPELRDRSAAYPFELAYRLINMYSIMGDTVLDPFLGTGTTTLAAICSARNSIGYEIEEKFAHSFDENLKNIENLQNGVVKNRVNNHIKFIEERKNENKICKYEANNYNFNVITGQEREINLPILEKITKNDCFEYNAKYSFNINLSNYIKSV